MKGVFALQERTRAAAVEEHCAFFSRVIPSGFNAPQEAGWYPPFRTGRRMLHPNPIKQGGSQNPLLKIIDLRQEKMGIFDQFSRRIFDLLPRRPSIGGYPGTCSGPAVPCKGP